MNTITRVFEFDAAHRILFETTKCFNLHGHRFKLEVTLNYKDDNYKLGYAMDFKVLKKLIGDFIDKKLDHSMIANPMDMEIIHLCHKNGWKVFQMGFGEQIQKNPTAENLAGELFSIIVLLLKDYSLTVKQVRLYETPNCWVDCFGGATIPGSYVMDL